MKENTLKEIQLGIDVLTDSKYIKPKPKYFVKNGIKYVTLTELELAHLITLGTFYGAEKGWIWAKRDSKSSIRKK